jgi:hypothetical protein
MPNLFLAFFLLIRRFERRNDDDVGPVQNGMPDLPHSFLHNAGPVDDWGTLACKQKANFINRLLPMAYNQLAMDPLASNLIHPPGKIPSSQSP